MFNNLPRFQRFQYLFNAATNRYEQQNPIPQFSTNNLFPATLQRAKTWSPKIKVKECLQVERNVMFTGLEPTKYDFCFVGNLREKIKSVQKQSLLIIVFYEVAKFGKIWQCMDIYYFMGYYKITPHLRQTFAHSFMQFLQRQNAR